jgi:hypothetical protein
MLQIIKPIIANAFKKLKGKPDTRSCEPAVFSFRGKEFVCSEDTISRLNYALSLNGSSERYVRVRELEE